MTIRHCLAAFLLFAGMIAAPHAAHAAQGNDNCSGFIDALPATISTSGVWCLRHDLSTAISSGNAVTIAANNITIDCNDFKIGGLAAGDASQANGIFASGQQNTTIRHCNIRGFSTGISLFGGAGHLVEDNRLDNNLATGILVIGDNNRVRRNAVYDTGGLTGYTDSAAIFAAADIDDNTIDGVFTAGATNTAIGIFEFAAGAQVSGNRVGGLMVTGSNPNAQAYGIAAYSGSLNTIAGNHIVAAVADTPGWGIRGSESPTPGICIGNTVANFHSSLYCLFGNSNGNLYH